MEKNNVIASLLELPEFEPDRKTVKLPRLNLVLELQEVPYNKLVRIRREEDAQLHLILAAVVNHPELRQAEWYHGKEGCATPVDALKKLLRMGEVEKLCRVIDQLNGYGPGSVTVLSGAELEGGGHRRGPGGAGKKRASRADLIAAQRLLMEHGVLPGTFLRLPPGERALVCAMMIDYKRQKEEG